MKKFNALLFSTLMILALFVFFAENAPAQTPEDLPPPEVQNQDQPPHKRPNLMQQLDLAPEQIRQIRRINQEVRPQIQEAAFRQRQARRALDQAIYSDNPNETEVRQRAREFAEAQGEVSRLRAAIEFRIRQVLTPEQLVRFRELRENFERRLRRATRQNQPPPNRPPRRPALRNQE